MVLLALEFLHAGIVRQVRHAGLAGGNHQLLGAQGYGLAVAHDFDDPLAGLVVVPCVLALGLHPVIQLHDLGIGFEPVAHLVLGREHRPIVREGQVGQVVVPDRIMQAERLVALAPGIAGPVVLLDDDGRNVQALQPRAQCDAALAAADDQHIGLLGGAERCLFLGFQLRPVLAARGDAVVGAEPAVLALLLLEALQLLRGSEQGPGPVGAMGIALQPHMAEAARELGLEGEPSLDDAVCLGGLVGELPAAGLHILQRGLQHVGDRRAALGRLDVPGEGDEVAPVAFRVEQSGGGLRIALAQRGVESGEPGGGALGRRGIRHVDLPGNVNCRAGCPGVSRQC